MRATRLLELASEKMQSILSTIADQDGEITSEQETVLGRALKEEEAGIADAAAAVFEWEEEAQTVRDTRKRWNERASAVIHRLERRAGIVRNLVTQAMVHRRLSGAVGPVKDGPVMVVLRPPSKSGRLELADNFLGGETTISGFTIDTEKMLESALPLEFFTARQVWVLDKDKLREHLEAGNLVDGARIVREHHIQLRLAGNVGD